MMLNITTMKPIKNETDNRSKNRKPEKRNQSNRYPNQKRHTNDWNVANAIGNAKEQQKFNERTIESKTNTKVMEYFAMFWITSICVGVLLFAINKFNKNDDHKF